VGLSMQARLCGAYPKIGLSSGRHLDRRFCVREELVKEECFDGLLETETETCLKLSLRGGQLRLSSAALRSSCLS